MVNQNKSFLSTLIVGPAICHAIVDITAEIFALPADAPGVIPFTVATSVIITVGGILIGLWLIRKEKQPEILELFSKDNY